MTEETLSFERYAELAMRTAKWGDEHFNLNHALQGITGEMGELMEELWEDNPVPANIIAEMGDGWWYFVYSCTAIKCSRKEVSEAGFSPKFRERLMVSEIHHRRSAFMRIELALLSLIVSGNIADTVKRYVTYGEDTLNRVKMLQHICEFEHILKLAEGYTSLGRKDVWVANIAKLEKRYPQKFFESDRALIRDILAEQEVLESYT